MTFNQTNHNADDVNNGTAEKPGLDKEKHIAFLAGLVKGMAFAKTPSDWRRGLMLIKLQVELYLLEG